jgi:hypothetical protein
MTTTTQTPEGLPNLPEPHCKTFEAKPEEFGLPFNRRTTTDYYTADQMQAYALAAIAAQQGVSDLEQCMNPRRWTKEMSAAWHGAIPNVQAAFEALRATAPPQKNPDDLDSGVCGGVHVPDTAAMYKALMFAQTALLPVSSGASIKALSLIDAILNAAPTGEGA